MRDNTFLIFSIILLFFNSFFLLYKLTQNKFHHKIYVFALIVLSIGLIPANALLYFYAPTLLFYVLDPFIALLPVILFIRLAGISFSSSESFSFSIAVVFHIWAMMIVSIIEDIFSLSWILLFSMLAVMLLLFNIIFLRYARMQDAYIHKVPNVNWLLLNIISVLLWVTVYICVLVLSDGKNSVSGTGIFVLSLFALLIPLSYAAAFVTFKNMLNIEMAHQNELRLKMQIELLEQQAEDFTRYEMTQRVLRHDFRHYIHCVDYLCKLKKYDEIEQATKEYEEHLDEALPQSDDSSPGKKQFRAYCSDPLLNAVFNYQINRFARESIPVTAHISLSDPLCVDAGEFANVISNALENAFNACMDMSAEAERKASVTVKDSPQLFMEIKNTYSGRILLDGDGLPYSRDSAHGFGTKSIVAFAKKHNAVYDYDISDTVFSLRMVLPPAQ